MASCHGEEEGVTVAFDHRHQYCRVVIFIIVISAGIIKGQILPKMILCTHRWWMRMDF